MSRSVNEYHRKQKQRKQQAVALAAVFVLVLWFQFGPKMSSPESATATLRIASHTAASDVSSNEISDVRGPVDTAIELPRLPVETIIAANPFAAPTAIKTETLPQLQPTEAPRQEIAPPAVAAIYKTPMGWAALVDNQIVRAGDRLPTGHEVLDVTPEGIRVGLAE